MRLLGGGLILRWRPIKPRPGSDKDRCQRTKPKREQEPLVATVILVLSEHAVEDGQKGPRHRKKNMHRQYLTDPREAAA